MDRLDLALRAARAGGEAILRYRADGVGVERKADGSPVTEADRASQRAILALLAAEDPGVPVVAEEQTAAEQARVDAAARFWCVDPLDGTREFVRGSDEFAVCVALVEAGQPLLGVVRMPALGLTYAAAAGRAFRQRDGGAAEPLPLSRASSAALQVVTSRDSAGVETDTWVRSMEAGGPVERRLAGSAYKFGLVATGEADVYPRPGRTMEWDTAAGQAIVEAAGGRVRTLDGGALTYGKPGFANPGFIVTGAGRAAAQLAFPALPSLP